MNFLRHNNRPKEAAIAKSLVLFLIGFAIIALSLNAFLDFRSVSRNKLNLPGIDIGVKEESTYNRFYTLSASYPVLGEDLFDKEVEKVANSLQEDFINKVNELPTNDSSANECVIDYQIYYYNNEFLSLGITSQTKVAGEDVKREKTLLYDRQDKKFLDIADLFKDNSNYLAILSGQSKIILEQSLGTDFDKKLVHRGTRPQQKTFDNFFINNKRKLVIVYQEGQVASRSEGVIHAKIKTNTFANLLKDDVASNLIFTPLDKTAFLETKEPLGLDPVAKLPFPQPKAREIDCSSQKCIALTFDDGPAAPTARLLDILSANNARATFFVLGVQVQSYPGEMKRMVNDGHAIGNHTFLHPDLMAISLDQAKNEIAQADAVIKSVTGISPSFARAPYGSIDNARARDLGLPFIGWTVDPLDWQIKDSQVIYNHIVNHTSAGAIILSHDIYGSTVDAFERVIPRLASDGYVFVTIDELLGSNLENKVYH